MPLARYRDPGEDGYRTRDVPDPSRAVPLLALPDVGIDLSGLFPVGPTGA